MVSLVCASLGLCVWFVLIESQRPPLWVYLVWANCLIAVAGFAERPPEGQIGLGELLLIPGVLALVVRMASMRRASER